MKHRLKGSWLLKSFESYQNNDRVEPWGEAKGLLVYADGLMSAQIMRPDRHFFARNDPFAGESHEVRNAFEGYLAYWGTYEVRLNEPSASVIHQVLGSSFPNWVGSIQRRDLSFDGPDLVLSTPAIVIDGKETISRLAWEPIQHHHWG